mmetsp:Transcript_31744/g.28836  ORF Transcript_31744/g.28836 Transcript_31744/m.28836 type:complete len:119 (-) Transcript_31744:1540-1896(-)
MEQINKKDPDSFSLDADPIDPEVSPKCFACVTTQSVSPNNLTPRTKSPRLQKLDSFSKEYPLPIITPEINYSSLPFNAKMTLRMCQAMNKEAKASKKLQDFLKEIDENLRQVEQLVRR